MAKVINNEFVKGSTSHSPYSFETIELESGRQVEGVVTSDVFSPCDYNHLSETEKNEILQDVFYSAIN